MSPTSPRPELIAPDGSRIVDEGWRPEPGGIRGAPARDADGNPRCVSCLVLLSPERGRSPYCQECKKAAARAAAQRRNRKRASADQERAALLRDRHYEGLGYTHGRRGIFIEAALLSDLRTTLAAALSGYVEWADVAAGGFDERKSRQYHQALNDLLLSVQDLNQILRGPFWPRADRHASHRTVDPDS